MFCTRNSQKEFAGIVLEEKLCLSFLRTIFSISFPNDRWSVNPVTCTSFDLKQLQKKAKIYFILQLSGRKFEY